jgi:hypothetical protein
MNNPCLTCHYARMKKDICGIYCVGSYFLDKNNTCSHYKNYKDKKVKK